MVLNGGATTLSINTLRIMAVGVKGLYVKLSTAIMLSVAFYFAPF
jgi:hypothetical protein